MYETMMMMMMMMMIFLNRLGVTHKCDTRIADRHSFSKWRQSTLRGQWYVFCT